MMASLSGRANGQEMYKTLIKDCFTVFVVDLLQLFALVSHAHSSTKTVVYCTSIMTIVIKELEPMVWNNANNNSTSISAKNKRHVLKFS